MPLLVHSSKLHPGQDGFGLDGKTLRLQGLNRIGNMLVPNENYCKFEEWLMPLLDKVTASPLLLLPCFYFLGRTPAATCCLNVSPNVTSPTPPFCPSPARAHARTSQMTDESVVSGIPWTPSTMIHRMGLEINNEESIYYWCAKHNIPVFSPALTDGSIGDMLFFHSYKKEGFVLDLVGDIRRINMLAMKVPPKLRSAPLPPQAIPPDNPHACIFLAWRGRRKETLTSLCLAQSKHTGAIIIGGGVVKHHIMNANLMRNGADHCVLINTGQVPTI